MARDHDDVPRASQVRPRSPEPFADPPFDPVPRDRVPDPPAGGDAEPRGTCGLSRRRHDDEGARHCAPALLRHVLVLARPEQTLRPPEATGGAGHRYFEGIETAIRLRPLARRRLSTFRPPGVLIRFRKPCTRFRRIRLGWYVRFMRDPGSDAPSARARARGRATVATRTSGCQRHDERSDRTACANSASIRTASHTPRVIRSPASPSAGRPPIGRHTRGVRTHSWRSRGICSDEHLRAFGRVRAPSLRLRRTHEQSETLKRDTRSTR